MDISTIVGLLVALVGIIFGYVIDGGHIQALFKASPALIVIGGTIGATIVSYGLPVCMQAVKALFASYSKKNAPDPEKLIKKILVLANVCRSEGLLQLQSRMSDPDLNGENNLMLKEGMLLATDMKDMESMQNTLQADINSFSVKKQLEISVFEGAGGFSPTLGIIGTVMGLVQVLSNITDASKLAASIASAFLATLYGIIFANIVYLPAANHLKVCLKRQMVYRDMIIDGMCMLASGESARNIENKLSLYYHAFDGGEKKYKAGIEN